MPRRFRLCAFAALLVVGSFCYLQAQRIETIDLNAMNDRQYAFLTPLLKDVEVVSLAESIHMTHEFPLARLGIIRWIHQNSGYDVLAFEGSPEDLWVSQDAFLKNSSSLSESTAGLFGIWNTDEMRSIFAYERSTWPSSHPLYITAYDIQPGTGKGSEGASVFTILQEHLAHYASPPAGFNGSAWQAALTPLTGACRSYKPSDEAKAVRAIDVLEQWIETAAPKVEAVYPNLPMHADALRLIPQNLRRSLDLCRAIGVPPGAQINWVTYKQTRDRLGAQHALAIKAASPNQRLMLWAHLSHLAYNSSKRNTSVGEILHRTLGPRLYTIGTFALSGGTIVIFNDINDDIGYTRISGVSGKLTSFLTQRYRETCFTDLHNLPPDSPMAGPQRLWLESNAVTIPLANDFDGAIWVTNVHAPELRLPLFLVFAGLHYIKPAVTSMYILLAVLICWLAYRRRRRNRSYTQ